MPTAEELKQIVKEKYSEIALQSKEQNETSCCGATGGCATDITLMAEDYSKLAGYQTDADLGLGCGLPTEYARMKAGDTVLDLGSGAGNDCFVARSVVGESGKVIGVDMTEAMIQKAKANAQKLGFTNVEFRLGEIEDLPLAANRVDVVVSNCVLNLVPNKEQAFKETYRVLKPKGHFSISDVVLKGELPVGLQKAAEMYAGCVSGAIQQEDYLRLIKETGFENVQVQKKRLITLPDDLLSNYLSDAELKTYKASGTGIYSITVYAEKPDSTCCSPSSGCC
ncbi:arsenite S-adenosylmethyltransferase [Adhaeribacter arboris]|uniref:Arsenite methyltransferase n=1 Tax=Adhaeribacter arboris TaxID=2072846 RepID=A0A2T2YPH1_9BACT|nr:arsenite methyltransferase [Adhaeribacter arboris]PSR57388.1 arsenite S-adenosylmethyltransferase [Adhaeribacter arboris]